MRNVLTQIAAAGAIATVLLLAAGPAAAKSTKECDEEYSMRKGVVDAANEKKSEFMAACRILGSGEPTPVTTSAAPIPAGIQRQSQNTTGGKAAPGP